MNRLITAAPGSLSRALDEPTEDGFGLLIELRDLSELRTMNVDLARHELRLARSCVGVAVVSTDEVVQRIVRDRAGHARFPLTAVPDTDVATGWLQAQLASGLRATRRPGGHRTVGVTLDLDEYISAHTRPIEDPVALRLARRTAARFGHAATSMNVGGAEGALLQLLVKLTNAREVAEIGTFTGMSALWLARGLPAGGRLTCFESWSEPLELARAAWAAAGVDDRIDVVLGPAPDSLDSMSPDWRIDLAFVDGDKRGYIGYVEAVLRRLTPGGLVVVDNTLWGGSVAEVDVLDRDAGAVRELNSWLVGRGDLDVVILPVGDGLTLVRPT